MQRREGTVKWYKEEKGYGRIMLDGQNGNHVFVHFSGITPDPIRFPNGFHFLKEGQRVSFNLVEHPQATDSQRWTATDVEIIGE